MKRKSYLSSTEISENYHPVDEVDNDNDDDIDIDNDNDNFKMIIFREIPPSWGGWLPASPMHWHLTASQNAALLFSVSSFSFRFSFYARKVLRSLF